MSVYVHITTACV